MPRVWLHLPELRLRIVGGSQAEHYVRLFAPSKNLLNLDPRIQLHGFVEDLRPFYAQAWVVLAPLVVSAGTNIKVLAAMACQRAVVTTPVGCQGLDLIDGHDAVIRSEMEEIAESVVQLVINKSLRSRIARNARATIEQRFTWDRAADLAYESYLRLAYAQCRPAVDLFDDFSPAGRPITVA
jgi:glycosyltransferase involved in cell wall biosynthesis